MRWVQLCGSLSILWHCLSLGLEWKRTFSSPVATAEFSKFTGILSAALSQHHVSGFEIAPPLWLSGSWRSFLYSSSVYSCHLFLISSASIKSLPFLSFIERIFAWNVPLVSLIFLKRSLVFPILLFSSISLHWSLRKAFLSLLAILWNSAFKWVLSFLFSFAFSFSSFLSYL